MWFRRAAMRPPFFSQKQPLRGAKHFPHPVPCRLRHETARVSSLYAVLPDHARLLPADSEGAGILFIEGFPKKTVPSAASRASTAYLQYHRKGRFLLMNSCPAEGPGKTSFIPAPSPHSSRKTAPKARLRNTAYLPPHLPLPRPLFFPPQCPKKSGASGSAFVFSGSITSRP